MKELNLTEKQIRVAFERLKKIGFIHFEGNGKGGHWVASQLENRN